jgi:hypothetical protein
MQSIRGGFFAHVPFLPTRRDARHINMWDGIAEDLMQNGTYEIRYAAEAVNDLHGMRPFNRRQVLDGIELHLP